MNPLLQPYPHLGKYEGELNLTERLDTSPVADAEIGDVESFGHYQLFTGLDQDTDLGDLGNIAGAILETQSQGFVTATYYVSSHDARQAWQCLEREWEEWEEVTE